MPDPRPLLLDRRRLLALSGAGLASLALPRSDAQAWSAPRFRRDPFGLGVASGDPSPGGVVLWTRIAPDPTAPDGRGGVPNPSRQVAVDWEVATDDTFGAQSVVRRGVAHAVPELGHSVHVEVDGLAPGRDHWYRFRVGGDISPVGRTRPAPAAGAPLSSLAFAFASCANYPAGHFTVYRHLAADDLAVVFHLGDYVYEGKARGRIGRGHLPTTEMFSLADHRVRYGQYKSDPDLQAAHASAAFVVVMDDHEVENNWAGDVSQRDREPDRDPAVFRRRRAAAFQAYYENMPLRRASMPQGPDMQLFRRLPYGDLLDVHVLDTRQYRSDQARRRNSRVRHDPRRTLLGDRQERWLIDGLSGSRAAWQVIAQQSQVADIDLVDGPGEGWSSDNWNGYAHSREVLFDAVRERRVQDLVVLSGDAHVSMASDLRTRRAPAAPLVGAEFLGTSITSGGDGNDVKRVAPDRLEENPDLRFVNNRRGYQRVVATRDGLRCDYLVVPYVSRPGAPLVRRATGHVERGRPGIAAIEHGTVV